MFITSIFFNMISRKLLYLNKFNHFKPIAFNCYSKFVQRKPENILYQPSLTELVRTCDIKSDNDWENLKKTIIEQNAEKISNINIDTVLLSSLIKLQKYDSAFDYVKYLKKMNVNLNLATIGKLFKLYQEIIGDRLISKTEEEEILQLYKSVKEKYPVLDSITSENILAALSLTSEWKDCLKILEEIKITANPNLPSYCHVIIAAIKNNNEKLAWNLMEEVLAMERIPQDDVFTTYINKIDPNNKNALKKLEDLLEFLGNNDIICSEEVISDIRRLFEKMGKEANFVNIVTPSCPKCKTKFQRINLSLEEFTTLKKHFFQKVIVGKDIFRKSTPTELNQFQEFISQNKKYDVVIDGLNVAYSAGVKKGSVVTSNLLINVVRHFVNKNASVLVLGRNHMKGWPNIRYITQNADTFFTANISQDDPYLLYCALNSGLNTIIVTRDLMRNQLYLLKEVEMKRLFSRWLSQSQHQLLKVLNDGRTILKAPPSYSKTCQKIGKTWHIPYTNAENQNNYWLCIQL